MPQHGHAASKLFDAAVSVQKRAHAPYSNFQVGAAILAGNGEIFVGCNVENKAYPEGWCAETSAIASMVAAGEHQISEILVISPTDRIATPCGGCRQRIAEFGRPETIVYLASRSAIQQQTTLGELLPNSFAF